MRFAPLLILVCALLPAADSDPLPGKLDRIELTNGRALVGTIATETPENYTVRLPAGGGGDLIVKRERVAKIVRGVEDMPSAHPASEPMETAAVVRPAATNSPRPIDPIAALRADAKAKGVNVTRAMLAVVKVGMDYADTLKILGPGFTVTENVNRVSGYTLHHWINADGSSIRIEFRDGKVYRVMEVLSSKFKLPD